MWSLSLVSAVAVLAGSAQAKICTNITVPVQAMGRNGVFNQVTPQDPIDVTAFIQNATRQGGNYTQMVTTGYNTVSGNYNISAKFCTPNNGSSKSLQILTHGIGFDKSYWDIPYNGYNYSYINTLVDTFGYSTLSYDRLGIGNSSHGEPVNEIQAPLEIGALYSLTMMARQGKLPSVNTTFSKVIHVGHSFGSGQTYTLANMYPNITDGIVLTGFSTNGTFLPYFEAGGNFVQANLDQPLRFGSAQTATMLNQVLRTYGLSNIIAPVDLTTLNPLNYPNGYFISSDAQADQYLFFYPPHFDPNALYFAEMTKQPVTVGELLTVGSLPMMNQYNGPVLIVTGSNDLPFCGGDCLNTGGAGASIPAAAKMAFPNAKNFEAYIQPNTGHGINLHYNSTGAYNVIGNYLKTNGL